MQHLRWPLHSPLNVYRLILRAINLIRFADSPYEQVRRLITMSQYWDRDCLVAYTNSKLRTTIEHAYENVPYYRTRFLQLGLTPDDIRSVNDLEKLPILDRFILRDHLESLVAENWRDKNLARTATGGATGEPTPFYQSADYIRISGAFTRRHYHWVGWQLGDPYARVWGSGFDVGNLKSLSTRLRNLAMRRLVIPAWQLSEDTLPGYLCQLQKHQPVLIEGYTAPLVLLARYLLTHPDFLIRPKAIISSAEMLFPHQRRILTEAFRCPVFNRYGTREVGPIAYECEYGRLHICSEHVYLELAGEYATPDGNCLREILVTTLDRDCMPLIRYRIGDVAVRITAGCLCGRSLPVLEGLQGRVQDMLTLPDGRYLPGEFFPHLLKDFDIVKFQVRQPAVDQIDMLLVPGKTLGDPDVERMLGIIRRYVGESCKIKVHSVEQIPMTMTGKHRYVVSDIVAPVRNGEIE